MMHTRRCIIASSYEAVARTVAMVNSRTHLVIATPHTADEATVMVITAVVTVPQLVAVQRTTVRIDPQATKVEAAAT